MLDTRVNDMIELFEDSSECVVICDDGQRIVWMNTAAEQSNLSFIMNHSVAVMLQETAEQQKERWEAMKNSTVYRCSFAYYSATFEVKIKGFYNEKQEPYSLWIFKRQTESQNKALSQISLNEMTHLSKRYREAIFNIFNILYPLSTSLESVGKPQDIEYLNIIAHNCLSLYKTMINFNEYYKYLGKNNTLNPTIASLKSELDLFVNQVNFFLVKQGRRIELTKDEGDSLVNLDLSQFYLALLNVLNNAFRFSPADSVVQMELKNTENEVVLLIRDIGSGMSFESREKAFEAFYSKNPDTNIEDGLGLGLCLIKMIVEAHGGNLLLTSKVNEGTTLSIRFPKAEDLSGEQKLNSGETLGKLMQNRISIFFAFLDEACDFQMF